MKPVISGVPVNFKDKVIKKIFMIIGKYIIAAAKVVLGINKNKATNNCIKPRKFQYHPERYKASKKKPIGLSIEINVNLFPIIFVKPEGIKARDNMIRVNQVKKFAIFKEVIFS